jgi:hypothetical protein
LTLCTAASVASHGPVTWPLIVREEQRLRVFENRVLKKAFGHKRQEVTENWRKLHNEELHNLFSSPDNNIGVISRSMRLAGNEARVRHKSKAHSCWWVKLKENHY